MAIATVNPTTGQLIKSFEALSDAQLEVKLQKAADAFSSYRNVPFAARAQMMLKAAAILDGEKETFARMMTTEMGKTFRSAVDEAAKCAWQARLRRAGIGRSDRVERNRSVGRARRFFKSLRPPDQVGTSSGLSYMGRLIVFAAEAEKLAAEGLEEGASPDADYEGSAEKEHGVQAGAAFASPIHIFVEIQPERELVQRQGGADTIEQGHQTAGQERRRRGSRAHLDQPSKSHGKQKENPPDQVMDMRPANVNVVKRAEVAGSGVG